MSSESSPKDPELEPKSMIRWKGVLLDFYLRSALQLAPGWSFEALPTGVGRREGMRSVCSHWGPFCRTPSSLSKNSLLVLHSILFYPETSESKPR